MESPPTKQCCQETRRDYNIVLWGDTGNGKTTVKSWLLNRTDLSVSASATAGTLIPTTTKGSFFGGVISKASDWDEDDYSDVFLSITDTPGTGDAVLKDEDIIRDIAEHLKKIDGVNAFCLVVGDNPRRTDRTVKTFRMFVMMCNDLLEVLKRLVVVVNRFAAFESNAVEVDEDRECAENMFKKREHFVKYDLLLPMLEGLLSRKLMEGDEIYNVLSLVKVVGTNLKQIEEVKMVCAAKNLPDLVSWLDFKNMQKSLSVRGLIELVKQAMQCEPIKFDYALRLEKIKATAHFEDRQAIITIDRTMPLSIIVQEVHRAFPDLEERPVRLSYKVGQEGDANDLAQDDQVIHLMDEFSTEKDQGLRILKVARGYLDVMFVLHDLRPLGATEEDCQRFSTPHEISRGTIPENLEKHLVENLAPAFDREKHQIVFEVGTSTYSSFGNLRRVLETFPPGTTEVKVLLIRIPPPELQQLSKPLRDALQQKNMEHLAKPLLADGVCSLEDLATMTQHGDPTADLAKTQKALGENTAAKARFNDLKEDAVDEAEAKKYRKAQQKIRQKFGAVNESYKEFSKFMSEAEALRNKSLQAAKDGRESAETAVTTAIGEVKAHLDKFKLNLPEFKRVKSLPDLDRWLEFTNASFTAPEEVSAKEMMNNAKMLNGVFLSPTDFCKGSVIRTRRPVMWAPGAEDKMDDVFQFTASSSVEKTTQLMSVSAWDKMRAQHDANHASFGFHAEASGAAFIGVGVGFFSASVDVASANNEESSRHTAHHAKIEEQVKAKCIVAPQMELNVDGEHLRLTPLVLRTLADIASLEDLEIDAKIVEFYADFGSHVSTNSTLGVMRTYYAKRTFTATEDREQTEKAWAKSCDFAFSAAGGYAGIGGAFKFGVGVTRKKGSAGGSKTDALDSREEENVVVNKSLLAQRLPGNISDKELQDLAAKSNGTWRVLNRSYEERHLLPIWKLLEEYMRSNTEDHKSKKFEMKQFPRRMERVYYRDVLKFPALSKSCTSPEDALETERKVNEAIENCSSADLKELITKMRDRKKMVWSAQQQTYCNLCRKLCTVGSLDDHQLQECTAAQIKCSVCSDMVKRELMEMHLLTQCELREVPCHCGVKVPKPDLQVHQTMHCKLRKVTCRFCAQELAFMDMQDHVDEEHEKYVPCKGGCGTKRKKKDMNNLCLVCDGNKIVVCSGCGSNIRKNQQGSCPQCPGILRRRRWNEFVDSLQGVDAHMNSDDHWLINKWRSASLKDNFNFCYYKGGNARVSGFDEFGKVGSYSVFTGNRMTIVNVGSRGFVNWGVVAHHTRNGNTITMH